LSTEQRPRGDTFDQLLVERVAVFAVVDTGVAGRTQRDHVVRMIWTVVAEPVEMVNFEVQFAVAGRERGALSAPLTDAVGCTECEPTDNFASSVVGSSRSLGHRQSCRVSAVRIARHLTVCRRGQ
jgi:hypothetical protein